MKNMKEIPTFTRNLLLSICIFCILLITFSFYIWSETEINEANDLRHKSLLLANELRQNSEDLTRMARVYAVTGNPIHKQYYFEILDIQTGKMPRPLDYHKPYWFFVLANGKPPSSNSNEIISLYNLIRKLYLTEKELNLLSDIKIETELVNKLELDTLELANPSLPNSVANQYKARNILHSEKFFKVKANLLTSISIFYENIDLRTKSLISKYKNFALLSRIVLIFNAAGLFFMLFKTIKELNSSKEEIVKSETYLKNLVAVIPDTVFIFDNEFRYLDILSNNSSKLINSKEKLIGKTVFEVLPKDLANNAASLISEVLNTGKEKILEYSLEISGGKDWFEMRMLPISQSQTIAFARNISETKGAEKKVLENEKKFRKIFDGLPQGCQIISPDWRYIYVNLTVAQQAKCKVEDLLGYTMMEKFPGIEKSELFTKMERCAKEQISDRFENRFTFPDGSVGGFDLSILPIPEGLFVLSIDITARIQAEESLKENENFLRKVTDSIPSIIGYWKKDFTCKFANNKYMFWFGKSKEEMQGIHMRDALGEQIYESNLPNALKALNGEMVQFERVIPKPNGEIGYALGNFIPDLDENTGEVLGFIVLLTDVTELKETLMALDKAKQQADSANRAKSEFLASMSHEIRTPLNGVIGFSDLLRRTKLSDTQSQYMGIVFQSANSLMDLLNDILDFSKIEAGKLDLAIEKVDIFELIGLASDVIKFKAFEKHLEILLDIPPKLPRYIYSDPIRLRQILINLLGNAIKFTQEGEIEIKIEVLESKINTEGNLENQLLFSVRDTGIGISEKNREKIFEAFAQEDSSTTRKYGGTGLGLAISNKLLAMMNSKLELESEVNKGSKFYFVLKTKLEEGEKQNRSGFEEIKNVLVVDDNWHNRLILKEMLLLENIYSDMADNGENALVKLQEKNNYDLLITDFDMPSMNGLELIRKIRLNKLSSIKDIPIILLNSSANSELLDSQFKELNIQRILQKPIKIEVLLEALSFTKAKVALEIQEEKNEMLFDKQFKALVVDDDKINRLLATSILKKVTPNIVVFEAVNGREAIEKTKSENPDIIFMDVQMPDMNGHDATREIRQTKNGKNIPIIALTAGTVKEEIEQCFAAGMDDYASKPILIATFKEILLKWLFSKSK